MIYITASPEISSRQDLLPRPEELLCWVAQKNSILLDYAYQQLGEKVIFLTGFRINKGKLQSLQHLNRILKDHDHIELLWNEQLDPRSFHPYIRRLCLHIILFHYGGRACGEIASESCNFVWVYQAKKSA